MMSDLERGGSGRRLLALLAALLVASGAAGVYLASRAAGAAESARRAEEFLREDRRLAQRYTRTSPDAPVVSEGVTEARSSQFLENALQRHGISPDISHENPEERYEGDYLRIKTTISFENVGLSSIAGFLSEVRRQRPNLTLLSADIRRSGLGLDGRGARAAAKEDSWRGTLTYGALIPARSRS